METGVETRNSIAFHEMNEPFNPRQSCIPQGKRGLTCSTPTSGTKLLINGALLDSLSEGLTDEGNRSLL